MKTKDFFHLNWRSLVHALSIALFLIGMTLIHTVLNGGPHIIRFSVDSVQFVYVVETNTYNFFGWILSCDVAMDIGIFSTAIAFFIEFIMSTIKTER